MQNFHTKPYRENVIAVIQNAEGFILAGERSDHTGAWQLPQGGIDANENRLDALLREVREETGIAKVCVVKELTEAICYDFPPGENFGHIGKKFRGQRQWWFLCQLEPNQRWNLALSDGEFSQLTWKKPQELVDQIIWWKKDAYRAGLIKLGFTIS